MVAKVVAIAHFEYKNGADEENRKINVNKLRFKKKILTNEYKWLH